MTAGSRSSPAITSAGSPGNNCWSEKISTDTKNSVGTICTMRRARKFSIVARLFRTMSPSLKLKPDHAHEAIWHLLIALELGRMRDQERAVIDVYDRQVVEQDLVQLGVDRLALLDVGRRPSFFQQLIGLQIRIDAIVLRCLAAHEDVGVAVWVDAAAPVDLEDLELAGLGLLEGGREFDDADPDVETCFGGHGRHDLGDGLVLGPLGHHVVDGYGQADASLLQQRLGLCDVATVKGECLLVVGMRRADPLIAGGELAVEHDLVDRLAIDREIERLTYLCGLAQ